MLSEENYLQLLSKIQKNLAESDMALVRSMEGLIPGQMAHLATIASRGLTQVIGDMSTCGNLETC